MTVVETQHGKVRGVEVGDLMAFMNIPFAAPPTGERRWSAPAAPDAWAGIRDCADYGTQAWQPMMEGMGPLGFAFNARSAGNRAEDCLNLNVWTPGCDSRKRPVLVWIHGGGFSGGTGATPMYEGTSLAQRGDVVVVTLNYRLGALGFLNLAEVTGGRIPATGNEGLLDQVAALQWVRDNIGAFGGDPGRVTIFGESAGGMSVGALMAFKPAAGLFHGAIPQSGACSTAQPLARSAEVAEKLLEVMGISANAPVDAFFALDPAKLTDAQNSVSQQLGGGMVWQPCIDGELLSDMPIESVRRGSADGIPVLVGAARDEWRLFTAMPGFPSEFDDATLEAVLGAQIAEAGEVIEVYRAARQARGDAADAGTLYAAIETDRIFRMPAIHLAEAMAERGETAYQYLFTWESPWGDGGLGSPHAIDIGFVFGTHGFSEGSAEFFGSGPAADALSETVQDAWLAFASSGNPGTPQLTDWSPYARDGRQTALFGPEVAVVDDPYGEERAVWERVEASVGGL